MTHYLPAYVAGWNLAGYLPETDPEYFENLEDAAAYLRETLELWLEQDAELYDDGAWPEGPDPETRTAAEILEIGSSYVDGWYRELHLWAEPYTS